MKNKDSQSKKEKPKNLQTIDSSSMSLKNFFKKEKENPKTSNNTKKIFTTYDLEKEGEQKKQKEEEGDSSLKKPKKPTEETNSFKLNLEKERLNKLKKKILDSKDKSKSTSDITEYNKKSNIYLNYDYKIPGYNDSRSSSLKKKKKNKTAELHNKFIELAKNNIYQTNEQDLSLNSFKDLFANNLEIDNVVDKTFVEATNEFSFDRSNNFSTKETIISSIDSYEKKDIRFFNTNISNNKYDDLNFIKANNLDMNDKTFDEKSEFKNKEKLNWNFNDTFVNEEINYYRNYHYPTIDYFSEQENDASLFIAQKKYAKEIKEKLIAIFRKNNINTKIIAIDISSRVINFRLNLLNGVSVSEINSLKDDIKIILNVKSLRIQAPIPDKPLIGLEIPYMKGSLLSFNNTYKSINNAYSNNIKDKYKIFVGKDIYNQNLHFNFSLYSNILISTESESAKHNLLNIFLVSLLMKYNPEELNLVLIDTKGVDLMLYHNLPHLLMPIINETNKAFNSLNSIIKMIKERYILMMKNHVKNIDELNKKLGSNGLSRVLIVISEFSILNRKNTQLFNKLILLIKERGRAAGVFLLLATDSPSLDDFSFEFLRNLNLRLVSKLQNEEISKKIINKPGAEQLLFFDEILVWKKGETTFRAQASFILEENIKSFLSFIKKQSAAKYKMFVEEKDLDIKYLSEDSTYIRAAKIILCRKGSISVEVLKKELNINLILAKRIEDTLEYLGIIDPKISENAERKLMRKDICFDKRNW